MVCGALLYAVGRMGTEDAGQIATNNNGSNEPSGQTDDESAFPEIQTEGSGDGERNESSGTADEPTATNRDSERETSRSTTEETDALPQSGPADTLLSVVSLGALLVATYFYIDARRAHR